MACPRCGGDLERYALGDAESVVCGACGYIGVPVEHDSEPVVVESWEAALRRFDTRQAAVDAVAAADVDVTIPAETTDGESSADADDEESSERAGLEEEGDEGGDDGENGGDDESDDEAGVACPVCEKRFDTRHGMRIHRGLVHEE